MLAALGALCLAALAAATLGGYSLVMFASGSMSPQIPTGALAVVQAVAADRVAVGDVVTVPLQDGTQVTHRVVDVSAAPGGARSLTLRGDANDAADPAPYVVREVKRVVWSRPGLAGPIEWVQQPAVRLALSAVVAAYVATSLWPRSSSTRPSRRAAISASSRP